MSIRNKLTPRLAATALAVAMLCGTGVDARAQVLALPTPRLTVLLHDVQDLGPSLLGLHQYGDINGAGSWFHWKVDDAQQAHLSGLHNQGNPPANQPYDLFNGLTAPANCKTPPYTLTITSAAPGGLNAAGLGAATASYGNGRTVGLVVSGNVVLRVLCPVGNVDSFNAQALDINQNAIVVGASNAPMLATEWRYYGDGLPRSIDLGGSGISGFGNQGSVATAINNQNSIVGYAYTGSSMATSKHRAWMKPADRPANANIAPPGDKSYARDINDSNIVVGSVQGPGPMRAWAYLPERAAPLVLPVIESSSGTYTEAYAINKSGTIVGACNFRPCQWKLAYRTEAGVQMPYYLPPTELKAKLFTDYTVSYTRALRINDAGAMLVEGNVEVGGSNETRLFIFRVPK